MTTNHSQRNIVSFERLYKLCLFLSTLFFSLLSYSQESTVSSSLDSNNQSDNSLDSQSFSKATIYVVGGTTTFVDNSSTKNYTVTYIEHTSKTTEESDFSELPEVKLQISKTEKKQKTFEEELVKPKKVFPKIPLIVKLKNTNEERFELLKSQKTFASLPNQILSKFLNTTVSTVILHVFDFVDLVISDFVTDNFKLNSYTNLESRGPPKA